MPVSIFHNIFLLQNSLNERKREWSGLLKICGNGFFFALGIVNSCAKFEDGRLKNNKSLSIRRDVGGCHETDGKVVWSIYVAH